MIDIHPCRRGLAARRELEHRLELCKPLGWLVGSAIAQKQNPDGWLGRRASRCQDETDQEQAMHREKPHSCSFMIAAPFEVGVVLIMGRSPASEPLSFVSTNPVSRQLSC